MSEQHTESPQIEQSSVNATKLLGRVLDVKRLMPTGLSTEDIGEFFEDIVFPAVREQRYGHTEQVSRHVPAEVTEKVLKERFTEIRLYLGGLSFAEVGEKTGVIEHTARTNVARTINNLQGSAYDSSFFMQRLFADHPDITIAEWRKGYPKRVQKVRRASETQPAQDAAATQKPPSNTGSPTESAHVPRKARRQTAEKDGVGLYLNDIAKVPLLTAAEEVELSKTIEAGLYAEQLLAAENLTIDASKEELEWLAREGARAKEQFVNANLRLVVSVARKYGYSQMPMLDLVQEGNTGLMRAVEKFDYTKGYKFSTYASWWIRQSITRGIAQQSRLVRLPVHTAEEVNRVNTINRRLELQLGHAPEPAEIAKELGKTSEWVIDRLRWDKEHISLDMPLGGDATTTLGDMIAEDTIAGPEVTFASREMQERVSALVDALGNERQSYIIRARFGLLGGRPQTLAEIGLTLGVTQERVRQLEREAMATLRMLADSDLNEETA